MACNGTTKFLTLGPGENRGCIEIIIGQDNIFESTESLNLILSSNDTAVTVGVNSSTTVDIINVGGKLRNVNNI